MYAHMSDLFILYYFHFPWTISFFFSLSVTHFNRMWIFPRMLFTKRCMNMMELCEIFQKHKIDSTNRELADLRNKFDWWKRIHTDTFMRQWSMHICILSDFIIGKSCYISRKPTECCLLTAGQKNRNKTRKCKMRYINLIDKYICSIFFASASQQ